MECVPLALPVVCCHRQLLSINNRTRQTDRNGRVSEFDYDSAFSATKMFVTARVKRYGDV